MPNYATGEPPNWWMPPVTSTINLSNCPKCGGMVMSGMVHHCPTTVVRFDPGLTAPERKPHKCPVCKGRGKVGRRGLSHTTDPGETCPACKGACVLWG